MSWGIFWFIFDTLAIWPTLLYYNMMSFKRTRPLRSALKPFCKYGTAPMTEVSIFHDWMMGDSGWMRFFGVFLILFYGYIWWRIWHDDVDDDYWKKKRKKAAAKIKEVAGKLVVIPIPAPG